MLAVLGRLRAWVCAGWNCTFGYIPDDLLAMDAAGRGRLACYSSLLALLFASVFTAVNSFRRGRTRASMGSRCKTGLMTVVC